MVIDTSSVLAWLKHEFECKNNFLIKTGVF